MNVMRDYVSAIYPSPFELFVSCLQPCDCAAACLGLGSAEINVKVYAVYNLYLYGCDVMGAFSHTSHLLFMDIGFCAHRKTHTTI